MCNKKVLLHERKRHTTRQVSSTPSAVLSLRGYPIHDWGTPQPPSWPSQGVSHPWLGYLPQSGPGWGTPLEGTWDKSLGYLSERTWDQLKYYGMGMGTPPGVNRQTPVKTVPSHRVTYAGGKNSHGKSKSNSRYLKMLWWNQSCTLNERMLHVFMNIGSDPKISEL